ncbi:MAG: D-alanyl-D-alanine carboxypeptidase [Phormidesmis priestleyi]|uniref:D-alanyl-D-alanine carboxypeptidase n=1 Tax=Phormidesmis priestleyi TaxID=268141 RepID=A0A2W4X3Z9_9CYAN|nr:MAG: D-alanyl-D-alanine carboxypeptidase [Phormidesmis priestleyi]
MSIPPIKASENDIPQARRQSVTAEGDKLPNSKLFTVERPREWPLSPIRGLALMSLVVGCALAVWQWNAISYQVRAQANGVKGVLTASRDRLKGSSANAEANSTGNSTGSESDDPPELLHHRRYAEAAIADLVPIDSNSEIKLRPAAAASINKMIAQANSEGVQLGVVSGFRSIADQNYLFFGVKAERGETSKTRAEVSAPPGYSEHHTGYAVDFIDESQPDTYTEESFEETAAYQWLMKNAAFYNFEMSFPQDPTSPLSYEPWHWRYVGDQKSLELFYKE